MRKLLRLSESCHDVSIWFTSVLVYSPGTFNVMGFVVITGLTGTGVTLLQCSLTWTMNWRRINCELQSF